MRSLYVPGLVLAALAGAWYFLGSGEDATGERPAAGPVPVTDWVIATQPFQSRVDALGTLRAWESITITASVSETVSRLHFEDGQRVSEGDLLVTLQQEEEQALLREQEEFLAEQEREVARLEDLAKRKQVAVTELDQRRTQAAIARTRIAQERAKIDDRYITAPFAGVLGLRQVSPGALVEPGQVITTLDDLSRARLDFNVPARFLRFLQPGQQIEASTTAYPQSFTGEIAAVDSRVDPVNRSATARAIFPNPDVLLKPGMLMQVTVLGDQRSALLIPEESLVSRSTDHYVWRIEGEVARRVFVVIGDRRPGWVEVLEGVQAGDHIVRDGVARLRGKETAIRVLEN